MHTPTIILAGAALLLTAQTTPPEPPTEAQKKQALIIGYTLNGNSMVRPPHMGSIDVSHLVKSTIPTPSEVEIEAPPSGKGIGRK